jgi:hypothetical protein
MKGNPFDTIPEIEAATKECLRALTKDDFQSCFRSWQDRWNKCMGAHTRRGLWKVNPQVSEAARETCVCVWEGGG